MKKTISNIEIAAAVEAALEQHGFEVRGNILDEIDIERSPEEEQKPADPEIINQFINAFLAEYEEA